MFSLGIEPSITSTNGASSVAVGRVAERLQELLAAERRARAPCCAGGPSAGRGSRRAARPRCSAATAAVIETVSPSQLMPSEIQRMWTSSTPGGLCSARHVSLHSVAIALVAPRARATSTSSSSPRTTSTSRPPQAAQAQREAVQLALRAARAAAPRAPGTCSMLQLGALDAPCPARTSSKANVERRRHDLAQVPDLHLDARRRAGPPACRLAIAHDRPRRSRARAPLPQQILGSGSPTSWSITRRPPKAVSTSTMPGGSVLTSPISAALLAARHRAQRGERRRRPPRARRRRRACPRWPRTSGRCRGSRPRRRPPGRPARRPRARASRRRDARASSLSTDATPPRVASRRQRSAGPGGVEQRVDRRPQRARVGLDRRRSSSNSPRASMIAVPCSPIEPGDEDAVAGPQRARATARARGSTRPRPVVQTYMPSAWPRSTTFVSPATISTPAARGGRARSPRPRPRSSSAVQALLEDEREASARAGARPRRRGR